jgi:hypothetical protein
MTKPPRVGTDTKVRQCCAFWASPILITGFKEVQLRIVLMTISVSPSSQLPYPTGHSTNMCKFLVSSKSCVVCMTNVGRCSPVPPLLAAIRLEDSVRLYSKTTLSRYKEKLLYTYTRWSVLYPIPEGGLGPEQLNLLKNSSLFDKISPVTILITISSVFCKFNITFTKAIIYPTCIAVNNIVRNFL